ncbi:MAG TPA: nitrate reductase molybdenum cofactor assembly chaperone, partial [Pseudomonadales bacterium]|nr:nitrate reductase molybdenum cofactor assembly chaperone [Pseudomonadales bacterium]
LVDQDVMDAQEYYSQLFDRGRALSLLLFEHVHGDSRDRGQAMVDLLSVYQRNGFELSARELPDYIPLFLEYLSQRPESDLVEWLSDAAPIFGMLNARLEQRESPYQAIFRALLEWVPEAIDLAPLRQSAANEQRDDSLEAIDKIWEEEAVKFGAGGAASGCASQSKAPARITSNVKWVDGARAS